MLDITETDDESLERASKILDKPKNQIKKYLRHPLVQEQRAKYLHLTNQDSMFQLRNTVNTAVKQIIKVITEQKKPDGASEYSIILLKGLGILGTKVVMEHSFTPSDEFKKEVFKQLNTQVTDAEWKEAEKWIEEQNNNDNQNTNQSNDNIIELAETQQEGI
jgi:hypothetical protein